MSTPELKNVSQQASKDFSDFEKEALEEASVNTLKLDLQRHLNKLHREQREDIEEQISTIEKRCNEEVRKTLEKHVKSQIETHFKETLKTLHVDVLQLFSPLMKRAGEDVERLQVNVSKTNMLCHDIQEKYKFKWSRPFVILILSTAFTGAIMGLMLYLMQVTPLAVFLMNEDTRKVYDMGRYRTQIEELSKRIEATKNVQNLKKKGKSSHR